MSIEIPLKCPNEIHNFLMKSGRISRPWIAWNAAAPPPDPWRVRSPNSARLKRGRRGQRIERLNHETMGVMVVNSNSN